MTELCRKSRFFLVFCFLTLFITNCKEGDPAPTNNLALTFQTDGLSATSEIYVTDTEGNVLESKLANGQMTFFATTASPYYQLTIIDLVSPNNYSIKTYQQVPSSSYFIKSVAPGTVAGLHRISFPNIAYYKNFKMQSEHLNNILPVSDTEFDLQLKQAKSDLFLTLEKDDSGTPSYLIMQQAEVGKTTLLDEVKLNQFKPMLSKAISSTQSLSDSYRYQIHGNISETKRLLVSSYEPPETIVSPVNLYYPEPTYLFANYTTQISYDILKGDYLAFVSNIQTALVPSETVEQLDVKLISYQKVAGNYQFSLTGSAEWSHIQLQASQVDKSITWDVYTPFSTQNTIQIPAFLISYLNEKQFTFANDLNFQLIECSNDAATISYEDFLRLELKKDGTQPLVRNRLTTSYHLPQ